VTSLVSGLADARSFARPVKPAPTHDAAMPVLVVDRDAVRAKLLDNRKANLARFRAYRLKGIYPNNVFTGGLANIWRDQQGNYCAAATIIRASGEIALVEQIAEDDNFIKLADVTAGPVMDWMLTSGLTQEELVMIQKPFRPVTHEPAIAPVEPIAIDPTLRAAETARLAKLYRQIELRLAKQTKASLELAVQRLIDNPALAHSFLAS
jgi:hypothetical protein